MTTGLGAVFNTAQVRPGARVAVLGLGGVGMAAVQGATIAGASQIIGVDTEPARFALAAKLGATDFVDASSVDSVAGVKAASHGGVDYAFEAIGITATINQSVLMLRAGGIATVVGVGRGQFLNL
nr:zinc-binding dehydrogenase [Micromonospora sp. DSM 115978]